MSLGVTPYRRTLWQADIAETITLSAPWAVRRRGGEIAQARADGEVDESRHVNIKLWPTGAWTLDPIQTEITNLNEYVIGLSHIVAPDNASLLTQLQIIPSMVIERQFRQDSDLPGMEYAGGVALLGAPFIVRKIPAGGSWNEQLSSGVPSLLSGPDGTKVPDTPVDRVLESVDFYPNNQGFFVNWSNPATDISYPGPYFAFYFGQYALAVTGSGRANLYEYVQYTNGSPRAWQLRDTWKYARTGQVSGTAHSMAIWPHNGSRSGERFIVFTNGQVDYAQVSSSYTRTTATSVAPGDHVYSIRADRRYVDLSPGYATNPGPIRADIRRNWRMPVQISTLGWPTSGLLIDDPANMPPDASGANPAFYPVRLFADTVALAGTSITSTLIDSVSGAAFDPTINSSPAASFTFAGDGKNTPILWGYRINRDAVGGLVAPGAFTGGYLRSVNLLGYNGDPSQQSGSLTIKDPAGQLTRFQQRGEFSILIQIEHVENGKTYLTPVFRGYINDLSAKKRPPGRGGYPSPLWFDYSAPLQGLWTRLAEQTTGAMLMEQFYQDPSSPYHDLMGRPVNSPVKVTDAIRYLLTCTGFSPSQINIPDIEQRLYAGTGEKVDLGIISPNVDYAEMVMRLCRNYLGCYLLYDEGTDQWVLLFGTQLGTPPLYAFVSGNPPQGRVPSAPNAYGPLTTFMTDLSYTTLKCPYNVVHITTGIAQTSANTQQAVERWLYNFDSYQVPGASHLASPNHPDWRGHMLLTETQDKSLEVPGDVAATQRAVDYTARRIYDFACHAQRLAHFTAPLQFVIDPVTNLYRLPRFQDPILINGAPYLIKAVHLDYTRDVKQMMNVEAIQPIAGQYVPPGISALSFFRKASAKHALKTTGSFTDSNLYGVLGVPASAEHRMRNLPVNTDHAWPMQDPASGQFYYQAGY